MVHACNPSTQGLRLKDRLRGRAGQDSGREQEAEIETHRDRDAERERERERERENGRQRYTEWLGWRLEEACMEQGMEES
jgi:hypothetical protein